MSVYLTIYYWTFNIAFYIKSTFFRTPCDLKWILIHSQTYLLFSSYKYLSTISFPTPLLPFLLFSESLLVLWSTYNHKHIFTHTYTILNQGSTYMRKYVVLVWDWFIFHLIPTLRFWPSGKLFSVSGFQNYGKINFYCFE